MDQVVPYLAENEWARWLLGLIAVMFYFGIGLGLAADFMNRLEASLKSSGESMAEFHDVAFIVFFGFWLLWPTAVLAEVSYNLVGHMRRNL